MSDKQKSNNEVLSIQEITLNNKDAQKYENTYSQVVKLFNGEAMFKNPKVKAGDDVDILIQELAKEEQEELKKKFLEGAKKVINSRRALKKFINAKRQEMEKLIVEEMKKSTAEMQALLGIIEQASNVEKEIGESLTDLTSTPAETEEQS